MYTRRKGGGTRSAGRGAGDQKSAGNRADRRAWQGEGCLGTHLSGPSEGLNSGWRYCRTVHLYCKLLYTLSSCAADSFVSSCKHRAAAADGTAPKGRRMLDAHQRGADPPTLRDIVPAAEPPIRRALRRSSKTKTCREMSEQPWQRKCQAAPDIIGECAKYQQHLIEMWVDAALAASIAEQAAMADSRT